MMIVVAQTFCSTHTHTHNTRAVHVLLQHSTLVVVFVVVCTPWLLQAHAGGLSVDTATWKRALRALDVGVEAAASPSCRVPLPARLELVNAITQLYATHRCVHLYVYACMCVCVFTALCLQAAHGRSRPAAVLWVA